MDFILKLLLGLLVGIVAKFLMPGRDPGGCIVTMIIGLIGSAIGGFLASALHIEGGNFISFIFAVIGAVILLVLYRIIIGKRTM
jgi:uncharacterized membrane protein YeaQ/YmgE (transglycosylase-associated protein family)